MTLLPTRRHSGPVVVEPVRLDAKHAEVLRAVAVGAVWQTGEQDSYRRIYDADGSVLRQERVSWLVHDLEAIGFAMVGDWNQRGERPWRTTVAGRDWIASSMIGGLL